MTLRKIRALLYENGILLKDVAARAQRRPSTVRVVMAGKGTSRHIQGVIARMLKMPYEKLWGSESSHKRAA